MDNPERVTYFAATDARGQRVPFGIKSKDRDRHMYVIGKTGMGKSTLLENMAIQDIRNGEGLAFIDPHGGTVEKLLDYIPEDRIDDVVYFAPFDLDHPIAFNPMEDVGYDRRHLVVSGLMATFKKIWEDAWSARMEYILTNTLLALLEYPGATLLDVNRMYTDKAFRTKVVDNAKDPVVKDFWVKEFANYGDRYTQEATPAIQNKVGQFTGNPLIRNIIGQPKSSFDIREMMDNRKILLINLSKGLVGETNMRLLGSMLTTRLFLAAMSRADLPAAELEKKPHFYFYVDEFQNFANKTFAEILSESRKYKLDLVITHQYVQQMEEEVRDAVFGNVGTTVAFRVGPFDAEVLETIFMPKFTKEDIVALDKRQVYLTLMIDGVGSAPFSAVTIPPIEPPPESYRAQVVAASRVRYANERAKIEQRILEELTDSLESETPADARMRGKKPVPPRREGPPRPSTPERASPPPRQDARPAREMREDRPPRPEQRSEQRPEQRQEQRPPRAESRPPVLPKLPVPAAKTPEDLKAILRSMTAKNSEQKQKQESEHKESLKGALASVVTEPPRRDTPRSESAPMPKREEPAAPGPSRPEPQPFEVPEDRLRSILKGND